MFAFAEGDSKRDWLPNGRLQLDDCLQRQRHRSRRWLCCRIASKKSSRICPDVNVHRRGHDRQNLMVIQIKKSTNHLPRDYDRAVINAMRHDFKYSYARVKFTESSVPLDNSQNPTRAPAAGSRRHRDL